MFRACLKFMFINLTWDWSEYWRVFPSSGWIARVQTWSAEFRQSGFYKVGQGWGARVINTELSWSSVGNTGLGTLMGLKNSAQQRCQVGELERHQVVVRGQNASSWEFEGEAWICSPFPPLHREHSTEQKGGEGKALEREVEKTRGRCDEDTLWMLSHWAWLSAEGWERETEPDNEGEAWLRAWPVTAAETGGSQYRLEELSGDGDFERERGGRVWRPHWRASVISSTFSSSGRLWESSAGLVELGEGPSPRGNRQSFRSSQLHSQSSEKDNVWEGAEGSIHHRTSPPRRNTLFICLSGDHWLPHKPALYCSCSVGAPGLQGHTHAQPWWCLPGQLQGLSDGVRPKPSLAGSLSVCPPHPAWGEAAHHPDVPSPRAKATNACTP